jgi:hypothetical protein
LVKSAVALTKRIMKNYHGGHKAQLQLLKQIIGELAAGIVVDCYNIISKALVVDCYNIISKAFRRAGTG